MVRLRYASLALISLLILSGCTSSSNRLTGLVVSDGAIPDDTAQNALDEPGASPDPTSTAAEDTMQVPTNDTPVMIELLPIPISVRTG